MDYLFLLGRILYGGFFLLGGINHFMHLGMMSGYSASKGVPAAKAASSDHVEEPLPTCLPQGG